MFFLSDSTKHISNIVSSDECAAPKFTRLLTDVLVREGDAAVLECAVSGHPKPEVRWFLNKSEIVFSNRIKVNGVRRTCAVDSIHIAYRLCRPTRILLSVVGSLRRFLQI